MPTITVREYHPQSGALLGNISILNFGRITAGTTSKVKVLDIAFNDVSAVGNIKLGLIASGGLVVNNSPTDIDSDGSAGNGFFGIEDSPTFDASKSSQALTRHFAGVNTSISPSDSNNVAIGNRSLTISNYIYIDIEIGASDIKEGNGAYKIFFDYS